MEYKATSNESLEHSCLSQVEFVRSDNGKEYLQGYAARYFDEKDPGTRYEITPGVYEIIKRDAFVPALNAGNPIEFCVDHEFSSVVASTEDNTVILRNDSKGLFFQVLYDQNDPDFVRAKVKLGKNYFKGCSFRGDGPKPKYVREGNNWIRVVERIDKLSEVSVVRKPAYKSTVVQMVRSEIDAAQKTEVLRELLAKIKSQTPR